jgi:hypothetical protein
MKIADQRTTSTGRRVCSLPRVGAYQLFVYAMFMKLIAEATDLSIDGAVMDLVSTDLGQRFRHGFVGTAAT